MIVIGVPIGITVGGTFCFFVSLLGIVQKVRHVLLVIFPLLQSAIVVWQSQWNWVVTALSAAQLACAATIVIICAMTLIIHFHRLDSKQSHAYLIINMEIAAVFFALCCFDSLYQKFVLYFPTGTQPSSINHHY